VLLGTAGGPPWWTHTNREGIASAVVFGGDTGPSDNLIELASGANILVHEVIDSAWVELLLPSPRDDAQEGLYQHLIRAHTLVEDVGPIAEAAGVRTLVLSHLVPGNWPEFRWQRAQRGFSGKLIVGRDLDSISLRASGWSHAKGKIRRNSSECRSYPPALAGDPFLIRGI
jgi:ribonuclease BN (tRNA processing enzyme)